MTLNAIARDDSILPGIGWMILSTVFFVAVTGVVRHVGTNLPAPQSAFLRYFFGVMLLLPFIVGFLRRRPAPRLLAIFAARSTLHACGVILWFYAMARIPIAEVTALGYITPIFVTIGAIFVLGEKPHLRRFLAIFAGLLGTLVILRPGFHEISTGHIAQLCVAPFFATSYLIAKHLTRKADPTTIVAMLTIFCTLALTPPAIASWVPPSWSELGWMAASACFATMAHYCMTRAMRAAPLTVTQPVGFLQLVWASLLGIIAFGEPVEPMVLLGAGIVVASATFISHREAVAARQPITPPAGATKD